MSGWKPTIDADEAQRIGFFAGKQGYACLPPTNVTMPKASKKSFKKGWRKGWAARATTEVTTAA